MFPRMVISVSGFGAYNCCQSLPLTPPPPMYLNKSDGMTSVASPLECCHSLQRLSYSLSSLLYFIFFSFSKCLIIKVRLGNHLCPLQNRISWGRHKTYQFQTDWIWMTVPFLGGPLSPPFGPIGWQFPIWGILLHLNWHWQKVLERLEMVWYQIRIAVPLLRLYSGNNACNSICIFT